MERGPLLYSLGLDETWTPVWGTPPFCDYDVTTESPWQYALAMNDTGGLKEYEVIEDDLTADQPYSRDASPVSIRTKAYHCPQWGSTNDSADIPPASPVDLKGDSVELWLIPYAASKLRITCFPWGVEK